MEREERAKLFLIEASGNELYDRIRYRYNDREEIRVPESAVQLKKILPTIETGELDVRLSTIPQAGNGVFVRRAFEKDEIISYYDGPVVSGSDAANLPIRSHHKSIVTGGVWVVVGHLMKDGTPITDPNQQMRNGGLGAFLNDSRDDDNYNVQFLILDMKGNQRLWVDRIKAARKSQPSNKTMVRTLMPKFDSMITTSSQVKDSFALVRRIIIVVALRDINEGEELFVSYGNNYDFFPPILEEEEGGDGKKRAADREAELREKGEEKRMKLHQNIKPCASCEKETEFRDFLTQQYVCSYHCQIKHYKDFPELLSFFQHIV